MLGIILGAVIMLAAMYVIGRHEAEMSLPIALMIAAGVSVTMWILSVFLGPLALLIGFGLGMWAIHQFCYLGWGKSAAVTAIWFGGLIGFNILIMMLRGGAGA